LGAADRAMLTMLVVAGQINQRLDEICKREGITHDQYNVLRILRGAGAAGHPRCEIARRLISRAPDVTRLVDRLVRAGLVERSWAPENRRLSIARITGEGLRLLATIDPQLEAVRDEVVDGIPEADLEAFAQTCERMLR
jgi:DNA-binding MarR family transcriptional regulator